MKEEFYPLIIGGEETAAESGETFNVIDPGNGEVIAVVPKAGVGDARKAIDAAREAFDKGPWPRMTPAERANILFKVADLVEQNIERLSMLESRNQGKTLKMARDSDLPGTVDQIRFFAGIARHLEGISAAEYAGTGTSFTRRDPVGVVACITPWNYPIMMAVWKAIPALAAGCTIVLKPASVTPLTTIELVRLMHKAGIPTGAVNVVVGPGATVGRELTTDPKVDMVAFTGETATGREIMANASSNIKRLQLELGGKAPFIVFDDADLDAATEGAVVGGFVNAGQDCTAATRIYVQDNIYTKFLDMLVQKVKKIRLGYQLEDVDMGPLVSAPQREKVEYYVGRGLQQGAKLVCGGRRPMGGVFDKGFYYEPTVFVDAEQDMDIVRDEIFGPVLAVLRFSTLEEAIEKANDTIYGLASSVWTKDVRKAILVARSLRFGHVWINDHLPFPAEMPHGGFKQSGFGKDLSKYSFEDYTVVKHVYVDLTGEARKPWYYTVYGPKPA